MIQSKAKETVVDVWKLIVNFMVMFTYRKVEIVFSCGGN